MIEKITPRKLNNSKDARIQGALEMYDAYNVSINEFTDPSGDSSFSNNSISGTDTGDAGVIKPAKGNHAVTQDTTYLPDDTTKRRIIGSVSDEVNGVIYCFLRSQVAAEQGIYVIEGDTLDPVFTSAIFNFPYNGFVKADIVYAKEGPIIYFTDGENEPRKLHLNKAAEIQALDLDSNDRLRLNDFLMVCPKAPMHRPTFSFQSDPSVATNFAGSQGFQFAFQCIYDTGEETALSPYSNVAIPPSYLNQGSLSEPALNTDNVINVKIPTVSNGVVNFTENVSKIRLLVRPAGRGAFFEVTELEYNAVSAEFVGGYIAFNFSNDTILSGVPQEDVDKLNEAVPKTAKTQAIINDRLMYGNYTEGFDELDNVSCILDAYYNQRGEEFTNLEIGIKKLILPVGYEVGNKLIYTSNLKPDPDGTALDNSNNQLTYNRRTAYQFDLSALPSVIDAGTQLRLRLTIRPDKNFEIYDSRNSFHAFKNVGYDAGQNDPDAISVSGALRKIKRVQNGDDFDADTPAVLQFNKGVLVGDCKWTSVGVDSVTDGPTSNQSPIQLTTGHSPSCPFIIPSTSCTFSLALNFDQTINGSSTIKNIISRCLKNYFMTGTIDANGSDPIGNGVTAVLTDSNNQATSFIDQQLSNPSNYGVLGSFNADVAETIIQLFRQGESQAISTNTNHLPSAEPSPVGFMAMNTGTLKTSLFYVNGANDAVLGGDNDIGPIFCLEIDELVNDEYVTMIPKINKSGTLNWYWASKEFFTDGGDANIFLGDTIGEYGLSVIADQVVTETIVSFPANENLYFTYNHPFPVGQSYFQDFFGTTVAVNMFDVVDENISEDFNNTELSDFLPNSTTLARLKQIGYFTKSNTAVTSKVLKKVSLAQNFDGNDQFNLYSIVDGEVNVRRSTVSGPENQNFWYGLLYSCEYLGKQNNMFPLSRGWKGGGGYPGLLHGLFSYGNKSEYSDDTNADGNIDSNLSATALDAILDESYPEAEILNFASAVYSTSISLDPQSRSFKRYCSHDFGVVFFDERGRPGNVNPLGSVYVGGFKESQNTGSAFVTARFIQNQNNIPSWAHYYRMVYGGNSTIDDFVQYTAGGAFVAADSGGTDGLIYVSLNHLQENGDVSYTKAFGAVKEDGDKDMYTFSAGDKLRIISYFEGEETSTRVFVNEADHRFDVVGTVTLGEEDNPLVGENEDVHPAKMGQFVILKNNFRATGFSFADISQGRQIGAGTNTSDIYDQGTNFWNKRCVFEIYSPAKPQEAEDRIYYEIGKTYNIIKESGQRKYQTPTVVLTEGDVFFRKSAVNMQPFDGGEFLGLIGNGNGTFEERSEPNFESYYLESKTFTDSFPGADVKPFGKPRIVSREKEEVVSPFSIKFSDKTNPTSNTIRYSSFNNSKFPYKDLQSSDGPISYMLNLNDNLFCIQQLKCSSIPVARTVLADALGNETVVTSSKVLGTERYYAGMYGTSHPESVVNVDNFVYFASSDRREVYRFDGSQGIEVISGKGMGGFFDRTLLLNKDKDNRVVGGYDPDTDEFILSVNKEISEFSVAGFINPPDQADGTVIVDDSVEGFVGLTDEIGGGLADSDEFIQALLTSITQVTGALEENNNQVISILESISTVGDFLNQDYSGVPTTFTIEIPIGNDTYSVGPFINGSSYNAELQELQSSLFESLFLSISELLSRYQQLDTAYENALIITFGAAGTLQDSMEVLDNIFFQPTAIGVSQEQINAAFLDAGLQPGIGQTLLAVASEARTEVANAYNLFQASTPIPVDAQYLLDVVYGAGTVNIPEGFTPPDPFNVRFLAPGVGSFATVGDQIDYVLQTYSNAVQTIQSYVGEGAGGAIDVSGVVSSIFESIILNYGAGNDLVQELQTLLYGSDLTPGGGDGGLVENYNDLEASHNTLLEIAFGPDLQPSDPVYFNGELFLDGNGNVAEGYEGEIKAYEAIISGFDQYQNALYDEAGQFNADMLGLPTSEPPGAVSYTGTIQTPNGPEVKTKTFIASPDIASNYGFPVGSGYQYIVQQYSAGQEGDISIEDLQTEIANRTDVMNAVIEDAIGYSFADYGSDFFKSDTTGAQTAILIQQILFALEQRIPDQGLLSSIYATLFDYVNTEGVFITNPQQDNPLGVDLSGNLDIGGTDLTDGWGSSPGDIIGYESLFLEALSNALGNIIDTVMSENEGTAIRSAYSLAQWYNAWNSIANNNSTVINPVNNYTAQQIDEFASQTIEPEVVTETIFVEGLESFSQLVDFLRQAELSANQVKTIVNGFKFGSAEGTNIHLFADIDADANVGTADLLGFLTAFGAGGQATNPFEILAGYEGASIGAGLPD